MEWLETFLNENMSLITSYAVRIVGVLVVLFVAWVVSGWANRAIRRGMRRASIDETLGRFCGTLAKWTIMLLTLMGCLGLFGIDVTSFAAVLAAAGFAVGLAFQGTLSNFAAGVMLLVFRPFKVGDTVTVAGQTGKIDEIDLFTTTMDTPDNRRLIIPNSAIFGAVIENVTHHPVRRVDVAVGTEYAADLDRTREVLGKAAAGAPGRVADREWQVVLVELGASSVTWSVRVWARTPEFFAVKESLTRAVKVALDEAGIGIPFPQMDVHLDAPVT